MPVVFNWVALVVVLVVTAGNFSPLNEKAVKKRRGAPVAFLVRVAGNFVVVLGLVYPQGSFLGAIAASAVLCDYCTSQLDAAEVARAA